MRKTIRYGIDDSDGCIISRVGSEIAWPILDYEGMSPTNDFTLKYDLERVKVMDIVQELASIRWTYKIPLENKNLHRKFWGMHPLGGGSVTCKV